ncbi:MAG: hypothetical protein WD598_13415 [Acidimicrobiia bacterium]
MAAELSDTTIHEVTVHSIRPVGDDVLEVVFSVPFDTHRRGIRLDRNTVEAARGRLMHSSLEEIAFDVVSMGIREPRPLAEFHSADTAGVHWLKLAEWLEDIS